MPRLITLLPTVVAVIAGAHTSGCATIVKGTTQAIPVASDPSGARVNVDGKPAGTTPTTVTLDRKHSHLVSVELPGYEVENVAITNAVGRAVAGNIILGGLIGWGVDATSGAQYNLSPETVSLRLRAKHNGEDTPPLASQFSAELDKLDALHTGGRLSDDEYAKLRAALVLSFEAKKPPPGTTP